MMLETFEGFTAQNMQVYGSEKTRILSYLRSIFLSYYSNFAKITWPGNSRNLNFFWLCQKDLSTVACFEISDSTATILLEGQILGREYQITNIQSHYKNMDHIAYYRCVAKNSCFDYFSKILWRTSVLCSFW